MKITAPLLRQMADTAYRVRQWGQLEGMKKPQQLDEIVRGFKLDLRDFGVPFEGDEDDAESGSE